MGESFPEDKKKPENNNEHFLTEAEYQKLITILYPKDPFGLTIVHNACGEAGIQFDKNASEIEIPVKSNDGKITTKKISLAPETFGQEL